MQKYWIEGATPGCSKPILEKLRGHFGDLFAVRVDETSGIVEIEESADPQIVTFLLDEAGVVVRAIDG